MTEETTQNNIDNAVTENISPEMAKLHAEITELHRILSSEEIETTQYWQKAENRSLVAEITNAATKYFAQLSGSDNPIMVAIDLIDVDTTPQGEKLENPEQAAVIYLESPIDQLRIALGAPISKLVGENTENLRELIALQLASMMSEAILYNKENQPKIITPPSNTKVIESHGEQPDSGEIIDFPSRN